MPESELRFCKTCERDLPPESFHRDSSRSDGRALKCAECTSAYHKQWRDTNADTLLQRQRARRAENPEQHRTYTRNWARINKDRIRSQRLFKRFGITQEDFDRLLEEQGGRCAICGGFQECNTRHKDGEPMALMVDHDHATGRVRGLLCFNCNAGLGNLKDDPDILEIAAAYIRAG